MVHRAEVMQNRMIDFSVSVSRLALRMLERFEAIPGAALERITRECNELIAIFTASVMTASKPARQVRE